MKMARCIAASETQHSAAITGPKKYFRSSREKAFSRSELGTGRCVCIHCFRRWLASWNAGSRDEGGSPELSENRRTLPLVGVYDEN